MRCEACDARLAPEIPGPSLVLLFLGIYTGIATLVLWGVSRHPGQVAVIDRPLT